MVCAGTFRKPISPNKHMSRCGFVAYLAASVFANRLGRPSLVQSYIG